MKEKNIYYIYCIYWNSPWGWGPVIERPSSFNRWALSFAFEEFARGTFTGGLPSRPLRLARSMCSWHLSPSFRVNKIFPLDSNPRKQFLYRWKCIFRIKYYIFQIKFPLDVILSSWHYLFQTFLSFISIIFFTQKRLFTENSSLSLNQILLI
jgi:hypothetical protein